MEKHSEEEYAKIRRTAFVAVVVSTVAVVSSVVALPLLYSYVQSLQSHMVSEVEFCRVSYSFFAFACFCSSFEFALLTGLFGFKFIFERLILTAADLCFGSLAGWYVREYRPAIVVMMDISSL